MENKKLAIITYDHPHQKTQDLVCRLKLNGYDDLTLIVLPWEQRKRSTPLYLHRPDNPVSITTAEFCERFRMTHFFCGYDTLDKHFSNNKYDNILIGGAGILPKEVIKYNIINSHPGYVPNVRGLDALKWAILKGLPIAVTTHFIREEPDLGILIDREIVPLSFTDTFHSVARRHYELEIDMLVESITKIPDGKELHEKMGYPLNQRMSHRDELVMMKRFQRLIDGL